MIILTKYRMLFEDGFWIETQNLQEAEDHGNYTTVTEEIEIIYPSNVIE